MFESPVHQVHTRDDHCYSVVAVRRPRLAHGFISGRAKPRLAHGFISVVDAPAMRAQQWRPGWASARRDSAWVASSCIQNPNPCSKPFSWPCHLHLPRRALHACVCASQCPQQQHPGCGWPSHLDGHAQGTCCSHLPTPAHTGHMRVTSATSQPQLAILQAKTTSYIHGGTGQEQRPATQQLQLQEWRTAADKGRPARSGALRIV